MVLGLNNQLRLDTRVSTMNHDSTPSQCYVLRTATSTCASWGIQPGAPLPSAGQNMQLTLVMESWEKAKRPANA